MSFIAANAGLGDDMSLIVEKPMQLPVTYAEQQGALLVDDGNGNWAVCGANPALIGAVALTNGGADTTSLAGVGGFNIRGRKEFPNNTMQGILVQNSIRFRAKFIGTIPATAGGSYGVIRDTDGIWKVDFTNTATPRVKLVNIDNTTTPEKQTYVAVTFLAANVQTN